jgi:hypothetical protein
LSDLSTVGFFVPESPQPKVDLVLVFVADGYQEASIWAHTDEVQVGPGWWVVEYCPNDGAGRRIMTGGPKQLG